MAKLLETHPIGEIAKKSLNKGLLKRKDRDILFNYLLELRYKKILEQTKLPLPPISENIQALSFRERQVVYFASHGLSVKEIAQCINAIEERQVTVSTIYAIINKGIYRKFRCNCMSSMMYVAAKMQCIPFEYRLSSNKLGGNL